MAKKYDVVARTGTYTNKSGEEKGKYKNAGMVYEKDGKFGLMLDTPIILDDDGNVVKFFGLYEPKAKTEKPAEPAKATDDPNDDIPF